MPITRANGIDIHYQEEGSGDPLLLLMGITAPGSVWARHAECWRERFRCLMPDNRGVGRTSKPAGPYTTAMMADDMAGLLETLGTGPVRIVGCSMGSTIAQQLALRHPHLVRSLVLMCPWARCDRYARGIFAHLATLKARLRPEEFLHYVQLLIFAKGTWDDDASFADLQAGLNEASLNPEPQPLHGLEAQAAACVEHNVLADLPKIAVPALVIGGEADIFTPAWMAREVAQALPNADLHLYPDAGHAFHWERIVDFNPRVRDWLLAH